MYVSYFFPARNDPMDTDRYPTGSRVDVWWPDDEEWYAATVLKTRTMSHTVDGAETLCHEIFFDYDLDGDTQWHSLHNHDVRVCTTPSPVDESDTVPIRFLPAPVSMSGGPETSAGTALRCSRHAQRGIAFSVPRRCAASCSATITSME